MFATTKYPGKLVDVDPVEERMYRDINDRGVVYAESDLNFLPTKTAVVEGWLSRERSDHHDNPNGLYLSTLCPNWSDFSGEWFGFGSFLKLNPNLFPDLTWGSKPRKVTITITQE